jgi:hypothetical protein
VAYDEELADRIRELLGGEFDPKGVRARLDETVG